MKASAKAGLEQFLTYRLHVLNKLAERGIGERYQEKLGVTVPEARVIASVGSFGPFSIMDLARHANLDKSQASRAAEALIKQGLVQREASEEDGRVVLISLTPAGRELYRKVMPIARKWNADLFDCLNEDEKAALGAALDKIIESVQPQERSNAKRRSPDGLRRSHPAVKVDPEQIDAQTSAFRGSGYLVVRTTSLEIAV